MDRGAWQAMVDRVAKSQTRLSDLRPFRVRSVVVVFPPCPCFHEVWDVKRCSPCCRSWLMDISSPSLRILLHAVHAMHSQPASCCRVCSLSWAAFLTLELQAVHPSVNPCINFRDSDVSNPAPSGVFDTSPMWLIASQQRPDLPSVCPILGTDTTLHPAAVSQHLRDRMFFLFLLCDI